MTSRRQLRNYLLDPRVQLRYALYFFTFGVIAAILNQMMLVRTIQSSVLQLLFDDKVDALALTAGIAGPLSQLSWRTAMLFPVLGLACALFAIRITHRFVGPQVALLRHIEALKHADYDAVCELRSDDELQRVANALNELAAALRESEAQDPQRRQQEVAA